MFNTGLVSKVLSLSQIRHMHTGGMQYVNMQKKEKENYCNLYLFDGKYVMKTNFFSEEFVFKRDCSFIQKGIKILTFTTC